MENHEQKNHRPERYIRYVVIIFGAVLAALVIFFLADYQSLRSEQLISGRQFRLSQFLEHHGPLPTSDAGVVRTWMTFDYVNKLFALPPNYLKSQLSITNTAYPRLTLSSYAQSAKIDQSVVVTEVENAIRMYIAPLNTTSTPPRTGAPGTTTST